MKSDEIDAVEMVRRIRDDQSEKLRTMSDEERRGFYSEGARRLHEQLGIQSTEKKTA